MNVEAIFRFCLCQNNISFLPGILSLFLGDGESKKTSSSPSLKKNVSWSFNNVRLNVFLAKPVPQRDFKKAVQNQHVCLYTNKPEIIYIVLQSQYFTNYIHLRVFIFFFIYPSNLCLLSLFFKKEFIKTKKKSYTAFLTNTE